MARRATDPLIKVDPLTFINSQNNPRLSTPENLKNLFIQVLRDGEAAKKTSGTARPLTFDFLKKDMGLDEEQVMQLKSMVSIIVIS